MDYHAAVAIQKELACRVSRKPFPRLEGITAIGAADVSYHKLSARGYAAIVVGTYPDQTQLEVSTVSMEVDFPYIPGLLSFRELPLVKAAWNQLKVKPDILLCDGQGIAHPRRIGLASHVGVELGIPTVGCAKSRLVGEYEEPGYRKGSKSTLRDRDETIGAVLRTRDGVRPLFISIGHGISLAQCEELVLRLCTHTRLPNLARAAHQTVTKLRCGTMS